MKTGYIMGNSGGGMLIDFNGVNVTADKMLEGVVAINNAGQKVSGKIVDRGPNSFGAGFGEGGTGEDEYYAVNQLPEGYYHATTNPEWQPEARIKKAIVRQKLGVTANKIAKNETIAGIKGTWDGYKALSNALIINKALNVTIPGYSMGSGSLSKYTFKDETVLNSYILILGISINEDATQIPLIIPGPKFSEKITVPIGLPEGAIGESFSPSTGENKVYMVIGGTMNPSNNELSIGVRAWNLNSVSKAIHPQIKVYVKGCFMRV